MLIQYRAGHPELEDNFNNIVFYWAANQKEEPLKTVNIDVPKAQKFIQEKEEEYKEKFANPYEAARYGYIDDVIEPRNTRFRIVRALQTMASKKEMIPPRKHTNIPL